MRKTLLRMALYMFFVFVFCASTADAATITEIGSALMDRDIVCEQYEDCTPGLVTGRESCLLAELGLESVSGFGPYSSEPDDMGSGEFGNALCANSYQLAVIAPSGTFQFTGEGSGFRFQFPAGQVANQFAFRIVDQTSCEMEVAVFARGVETGLLPVSISGGFPLDIRYFESSEPFDALEIRSADPEEFGWCVDNVCLAGFGIAPPTPTSTPAYTGTALPTGTPLMISEGTTGYKSVMMIVFGMVTLIVSGIRRLRN